MVKLNLNKSWEKLVNTINSALFGTDTVHKSSAQRMEERFANLEKNNMQNVPPQNTHFGEIDDLVRKILYGDTNQQQTKP